MIRLIIMTTFIIFSIVKAAPLYFSQDSSKTKSLIFRIFSLDDNEDKKYEKGYIFDRIFRRREFHDPVKVIPLEMKYGFGYNTGGGFLGLGSLKDGWMNYEFESDAISKFNGGNFSSRLGHQLDLDFLKTNLAYYWFGNSWLDMHTGVNFRYASLLAPSTIPRDWNGTKESWKLDSRFSANMLELGWSQSLMLQWFESWFTTYRYTYGIAYSSFYKNEGSAYGYGPSQSFSVGGRYIVDQGLPYRFAFGADLKYSNTYIKKINDSEDITPIKNFSINTAGLYFTASVFFGGEKTKGDIGKSYYYTKDYMAANQVLAEFIDENPNHVNIVRARKIHIESARKIPYQLMKQGMSFDQRGMTEKAVEKYVRAKSMADTLLVGVISERLKEIAYREVEKAESWLNEGAGDSAIAHVTIVSGWYPEVKKYIKRFKISNLMMKGKNLYEIGLHERALSYFNRALKIDPGLTFEIAIYKNNIASDLLTMADSLNNLSSLRFVLYALEKSKDLTGGLNKTNQRILNQLKIKLSLKEDFEIRQKIDEILYKEKKKQEEIVRIVVGMTVSEVEVIMGKPYELISNGKENRNQLWIYKYSDGSEINLIFTNYKLFRIE